MNRIVYIKAEVIGEQEKTLTVKLLNGFGNPEEIVHKDFTLTPAQEANVQDARLKGSLRDVHALIESGMLNAAKLTIAEALR